MTDHHNLKMYKSTTFSGTARVRKVKDTGTCFTSDATIPVFIHSLNFFPCRDCGNLETQNRK